MELTIVDQPTLKATTRILLLEGGSLERVRGWTGEGHWENRVSSLTAENVAWLDSTLSSLSLSALGNPRASSIVSHEEDTTGLSVRQGQLVLTSEIGVWKHIAEDRSCPVNEMVVCPLASHSTVM